MAKEKIFIQIGDEVQELKGAELEAFETDRKTTKDSFNAIVAEAKTQKQLKIDAYTKLSLTEEEINAIL